MGAYILHAESIDVREEIPTSEITAHIEAKDASTELDPGHEENIARALQSHDHVVAATDDKVGDVLALREADCGIAV